MRLLRSEGAGHGAVSTGCEESVLKDLQKDKNAVEKEREPRKSALSFALEFLLPTLLSTLSPMLYNAWVEGNEPMVTVYSDRIEILSRGTLAPNQTLEGFYLGRSIPVNKKLSEIFIQLHISEKSGRGVPKIVEIYGRKAFKFEENDIVVTIPFNRIGQVGNNVGDKVGNNQNVLNQTRQSIISEMRNNPNITKIELSRILGISTTAIDNNITFLRKNGYIERIGSNKTGYWQVNEK